MKVLEPAPLSPPPLLLAAAEWCKPCKMIAPVIDELARKAGGKVVFLKVDVSDAASTPGSGTIVGAWLISNRTRQVDEARELAAAQEVKSMPTLIFFRNGKRVDTIVGADVPALREKVARATAHPLLRVLTAERVLIPALVAYMALPRLLPLLRPQARRAPWLPAFRAS